MVNTEDNETVIAHQFYQAVFVSSPDAIAIIDSQARYVEQNDAHRFLLGYCDADLLGQTPRLHTEDAVCERVLSALLKTGRFEGEIVSRRKDGTSVDIELKVSSIRAENGVLYYVGIKRDITEVKRAEQALSATRQENLTMERQRIEERKREEEALRESEARWRTLVDTAPDAIVAIDKLGLMTTCNEAAARMFGYAREEMLGQNVSLLMPSPHREAHGRYLNEYHRTGVRKVIGFWRELSGRRKDGTEFPLEVSVSETHLGGQLFFIGIMRDLSERKRVEGHLKEQAHLASFCARIGKHLVESRELADMLRDCTQTMVDDLGAAFARIWLLNEQDNVLELQASSGLYTNLEGRHARIPVGKLKIGQIAAEGTPHLTNQVIGDPRVPEQAWAQREGLVAFAGYPLVVEERVIGVMAMFSRSPLSELTLKAMGLVADQIALGIRRKRAEQSLVASEEQLQAVTTFQQAVMANIKEGLYTLNAEGLISFINPAAEELFGWTSAELLGRKMHNITHYKHPDGTPFPADECAGLQVLQQGKTLLEHADCFIRKDGSFFDVVYSSAPLWRDGKIDGLVVIFRDVTEKKRAQQALQESEARFRAIADVAPILIWVSDATKFCTWFNRPWLDFTGRTMREELGHSWTELIHPDDCDRCFHIYTSSFNQQQPFTMEYRLRRYDGQYRWVMDHGIPRYAENGEFLGYIGSCIDVTDRKESEIRTESFAEELERQVTARTAELLQYQERLRNLATELNLAEQRERRRLATDLHDHLQQLLVTCKIKLRMGRERRLSETAAERLTTETDELLTEALNYTRTLVAELSPPVLSQQGLGAGLKWLAEYMDRYGMSVSVSVPERRVRGLPDDQVILLFQSVRELLFNASKHAGTHEAWVTLEEKEGGLRIEVRDNGVGFAASALDAASAGSSKFGLFNIRERMSALGGSLHITSAPEVGTKALLVLPLIKQEESRIELSPTTGMQASKECRPKALKGVVQVLLVDDHAMVREGLRAILEGYPDVHVVGEAADGREALEAVRTFRPHVVVMDVNMPLIDGIKATAFIKQAYPDTIVLGLSVNAGQETREAIMQAGAVDLLTKEAAVEQLHKSIVKAVKASFLSET